MKAIATIFCLAALFAANSIAPGCNLFQSRVIPFRSVPSVPDDPFWQAQPTDSVGIIISKTTEFEVPHANEWAVQFPKLYPCIITRENGHCVLYGSHGVYRSSLSASEDSDFLDGICRWDLDSNDFEVRPFSNVQGLGSEVFAASIPGHPGPAFCRVYYDATSRNGYVPMGSRYFVVAFDTNGNQLSLTSPSTEAAGESLDLVNYQPIEYPDTCLFMLKGDEGWPAGDPSAPRRHWICDLSNGSIWLDPRSSTDVSKAMMGWIASTEEWICWDNVTADGQGQRRIDIIDKNGDIASLTPWTWPGFAWKNADEYRFSDILTFTYTWRGDRYLLLGVETQQSDGVPVPEVRKFWSVRFNPGDTEGELVWGREEPAELVSEGQIVQLGDDRRPYWVSFLMGTNVLRIIDLVSGKLVINTTLNLAPVTERGRYALLSLRLKKDSDIPAVFIFDRSGAKLIKLELEVPPSS